MDTSPSWPILHALALKTGVTLGGLSDTDRLWALAVASLRLSPEVPATEAQVNQALKDFLQEEGAFLRTDHVELRRWLVDTGWWTRDGYGHAYRACSPQALAPHLWPIAQSLSQGDVAQWMVECRKAAVQKRQARREAWAAQQGSITAKTSHAQALSAAPPNRQQTGPGRT